MQSNQVPSRPLTFFIAGTIQGSRVGTTIVDQSYRTHVRRVITDMYPDAEITCPQEVLATRFEGRIDAVFGEFNRLKSLRTLRADEYSPLLGEVKAAFLEMVERAGQVDVVVACLPGREASMGTAIEMWSASMNGRVVVAISEMSQHVAVVATADVVVPSIADFQALLATGWLDTALARRAEMEPAIRGNRRAPC